MSDNSWYEKGELPPVGSKCIVDSLLCTEEYVRSFNGMKVDIHFHMVDHQGDEIAIFSMVDPNDRDCLKFHGMMKNCFRPIKTEREISIDDMLKIPYTPEVINNRTIMGALYDAGYRKNES